VLLEVEQNDSDWEFFLPTPVKRLAEVSVVSFDVYSLADKLFESRFE
jgi:hypothetical protein